jgi:hypothetical protein
MDRAQVRECERMPRGLLGNMFSYGTWRYVPDQQLRIVPDAKDTRPGRAYFCVHVNSEWFTARLDGAHIQ